MARLFPLMLVLVLAAPGARAGEPAGAPILTRLLSVKQMGMGNLALAEYDVMRSWSNPALLAGQQGDYELAVGGSTRPATGQSAFGAGAGWRPGQHWVLGALVASSGFSLRETGADGLETGKQVGENSLAAGMCGAWAGSVFKAGLGTKLVSETLDGENATGIAVDAGLAADWSGFTFAGAARNLGPALRPARDGAPGEALPFEWRAGVAYRVAPWGAGIGAEYVAVSGRQGILGTGVCWSPATAVTVRAGVTGLGTEGLRETQLTCGLSGSYRGLGLDYALGIHDMGMIHRFSLSAVPWKQAGTGQGQEAAKKINLAVMDFSPQSVSASDAVVISDMLRGEMVKTGAFNVIEKQNMDKIMAEQAFQQTGCTSEECAVKLGKLLNVRTILVGSFGKIMGVHVVNLRVVDVETGRIEFGDKVTGATLADLDSGLSAIAKRIAKKLR